MKRHIMEIWLAKNFKNMTRPLTINNPNDYSLCNSTSLVYAYDSIMFINIQIVCIHRCQVTQKYNPSLIIYKCFPNILFVYNLPIPHPTPSCRPPFCIKSNFKSESSDYWIRQDTKLGNRCVPINPICSNYCLWTYMLNWGSGKF